MCFCTTVISTGPTFLFPCSVQHVSPPCVHGLCTGIHACPSLQLWNVSQTLLAIQNILLKPVSVLTISKGNKTFFSFFLSSSLPLTEMLHRQTRDFFFSFLFLMLIISRAAGWWDYWRSVCVLGILCPFVHFSNPDKSGSGLRQGVGQDEDGWGAGLASGRLTFSPGADTWIDSLCHGSVIHSCLSFTHTHTQTRV